MSCESSHCVSRLVRRAPKRGIIPLDHIPFPCVHTHRCFIRTVWIRYDSKRECMIDIVHIDVPVNVTGASRTARRVRFPRPSRPRGRPRDLVVGTRLRRSVASRLVASSRLVSCARSRVRPRARSLGRRRDGCRGRGRGRGRRRRLRDDEADEDGVEEVDDDEHDVFVAVSRGRARGREGGRSRRRARRTRRGR